MKRKFTTKQLKNVQKRIKQLERQLSRLDAAIQNEEERVEIHLDWLDVREDSGTITAKQKKEYKELDRYYNQLDKIQFGV